MEPEKMGTQIITNERGFKTCNPAINFGISAIKDLLYKSKVANKRKEKIVHAMAENSKPFEFFFENIFGKKLTKSLSHYFSNELFDEAESLSDSLRRQLFLRSLKPTQLITWIKYSIQVLRMFTYPYHFILVFMGPDGSGKTSVAKEVLRAKGLQLLFKKHNFFHTRFPILPPLGQIKSFFRKKSRDSNYIENPRSTQPLPILKSMLYPFYYALNNSMAYPWLFINGIRGGSFIIFDRYYYEYFIQQEFQHCPHFFLNILTFFIPKPDMIIFLKSKPEVVFARKEELSIFEIQEQVISIEAFTNTQSSTVTISGEKTIPEIKDEIINNILNKLDTVTR